MSERKSFWIFWSIFFILTGLFAGLLGKSAKASVASLISQAGLNHPTHVSIDRTSDEASPNLVIAGFGEHRIQILCRSSSQGICRQLGIQGGSEFHSDEGLRVLAGNGYPVNSGDGTSATQAAISDPSATAVDSQGNIVIANPTFHTIRVVCMNRSGVCSGSTDGVRIFADHQEGGGQPIIPGNIYHLAGVWTQASINPNYGYGHGSGCAGQGDGVAANDSCLNSPYGVAIDSMDNVLVADTNNSRIRVICLNRLSDDPYCSNTENGAVVPQGELALPGGIYTVAGGGSDLGDGVPSSASQLLFPLSVAIDRFDNIAVADGAHWSARLICAADSGLCRNSRSAGPRTIITIASNLKSIGGVGFDSANHLLISEPQNSSIRVVCGPQEASDCGKLIHGFRYPMHAVGLPGPGAPLVVTDSAEGAIRLIFY